MVEDPVDFVAGGVHTEAAREEWEQLPDPCVDTCVTLDPAQGMV